MLAPNQLVPYHQQRERRPGPPQQGWWIEADRLIAEAPELHRRLREATEAVIANAAGLLAENHRKEQRAQRKKAELRVLQGRLEYNEGRVRELARIVGERWNENNLLREECERTQALLDEHLATYDTEPELVHEMQDVVDVVSSMGGT